MKRKHLFLAIAALFAAGGLWLAWAAWRPDHSASHESRTGANLRTPSDRPQPRQILNAPARLQPPDPNRRFRELTPEERVQFARQPRGG